ncbi:hypothetical protein TNCV_4127461 [Trichonephila clavipes]|uniref:Uncharacterized protein n=1 Tax=Trichonephila clavipes TaxID=2585209 RepID=A0A8X6VRN3_TRICX|nr:hypothetical protein TNCV_4127461 [Trichonephila clavipes]
MSARHLYSAGSRESILIGGCFPTLNHQTPMKEIFGTKVPILGHQTVRSARFSTKFHNTDESNLGASNSTIQHKFLKRAFQSWYIIWPEKGRPS